jgi:DNA polymerase-3 subunit delta'
MEVKQRLAAWIDSETMEAPVLLTALASTGLDSLLLFVRQYMVCTSDTRPCGACVACRQAENFSHPDITVAQGSKRTLSVKEIQNVLGQAQHTSLHGKRLLVIPNAHLLSAPAVAALLKTLEEPAVSARWLLTTPFKRQMLATILSRCTVMQFADTNKEASGVTLPTFGTSTELLTEEELEAVATFLDTQLHQRGNSPSLVKAWMRLRDYYKIKSQRGNEKMAGQVLLASLEGLRESTAHPKL